MFLKIMIYLRVNSQFLILFNLSVLRSAWESSWSRMERRSLLSSPKTVVSTLLRRTTRFVLYWVRDFLNIESSFSRFWYQDLVVRATSLVTFPESVARRSQNLVSEEMPFKIGKEVWEIVLTGFIELSFSHRQCHWPEPCPHWWTHHLSLEAGVSH